MVKKLASIISTTVLLTVAFWSPALANADKRDRNTPVYYLSLGTSLAAGVQADPVTGESIVTDVSYPGLLAAMIGQDIHKLRHINLGCPGETSQTLIYGGKCDYRKGSQLDQAVHFLRAHGKFTGLITIDVGANDILGCVDGTDVDETCITDTLAQLTSDLAYILETLQEEAPGVPIVGMNYYNPLLIYWYTNPEFAASTIGLQLYMNGLLESVYSAYFVPVADVANAFMSYDLITDTNCDGVPNSIELLCTWTWMCSKMNIHANDEGYAVMAEEFFSVLPEIPISKPPRKHYRPQITSKVCTGCTRMGLGQVGDQKDIYPLTFEGEIR